MSVERVRTLENLYTTGQTTEVVDLALEKLFAYELGETRQQLAQLEKDLTGFENRYDLSSGAFYDRFQAGEMGDAMDFVEWASLFQMAERLRERISLIEAA